MVLTGLTAAVRASLVGRRPLSTGVASTGQRRFAQRSNSAAMILILPITATTSLMLCPIISFGNTE